MKKINEKSTWGGGRLGKSNKIWLIILVIFFVLLIIGTSYALWNITLKQGGTNTVTTSCFNITFKDQNPVQLENAYPIKDTEGKMLSPYIFTITNTCQSFAKYQINLEILNNTTLKNLDHIKLMLNDEVNLLTDNNETTKTIQDADKSFLLKTGYLREKQSKIFDLRLWLSDDTPTDLELMNKQFVAKVTIITTYQKNLDNNINIDVESLNEGYNDSETFSFHVTSEKYDIVSISTDLENWEKLDQKGKDIIIEKTVTENGNHTYYFMDDAGNVKNITFTASKIDDKKPIANMTVNKQDDIITIDASTSKDNETSITKYYYSKDGINFDVKTTNTYQFSNLFQYTTATDTIKNYEENEVKKVYLKVEDEFGNISDVKEERVSTDFSYDETVDNNLRYIGKDPNNYVDFNGEKWRIIGVMNNIDDGKGTKSTRIKLVRNHSIGEFASDVSSSSVNFGWGVNEWSQTKLKNLLNSNYYNSVSGNFSYYDEYEAGNKLTNSFNGNGLSASSKNLIDSVLWNTGANGDIITDYDPDFNNNVYDFYRDERSNNIGKRCSTGGVFCTDNVTRTTTWKGIVGLIYPSDYGFATAGGVDESRNTCLVKKNYYSSPTINSCKEQNWLYKNDYYWTISPAAMFNSNEMMFFVTREGYICRSMQGYKRNVYPVVYLKKDVKITSGNGTLDNSFKLS